MTIISNADNTARTAWSSDATRRMNHMYRWQRFCYDATRRYYLLGRDRIIADLAPAPGARVLEIGCGTGRNLICAATLYPQATFHGIDVSTEMLTTAIAAIARRDLSGRIRVAHGDATRFDPARLFQTGAYHHIMISYSLSMILEWRQVLDHAVSCLAPGGRLHVVDFGNQARLPLLARRLLLRWLTMFDVTPRAELFDALGTLAARHGGTLSCAHPYRGYAQSAVLALPD